MKEPEYLYHYTSMEKLALILKYQTIRFNSLDKMDDLQEKETSDLRNIGEFCYVSSWTEDDCESIPMWKMYTDPKSGVRIKLSSEPFYTHHSSSLKDILAHSSPAHTGVCYSKYIPLKQMQKKGFIVMTIGDDKLLQQVKYTSDKDKLYPQIVYGNKPDLHFELRSLGKYKNTYWAFQKEWRYIFYCFPAQYGLSSLGKPIMNILDIYRDREMQVFQYYDMPITKDAYANMAITLSPQISLGNRVIIKALLDKFNTSATLEESSLYGLI